VICAGATTAYLNLAIHVIDRLAGHDLAVATAKALSMDRHPESQRPYFLFIARKDHGDDKVLQLQLWIETHHGRAIGMDDMVAAAGMSARNLNRRFSRRPASRPGNTCAGFASRPPSALWRRRTPPSSASPSRSAIAIPAPSSEPSA
jgi:transcriptional regulator GlxA family with amidase domain